MISRHIQPSNCSFLHKQIVLPSCCSEGEKKQVEPRRSQSLEQTPAWGCEAKCDITKGKTFIASKRSNGWTFQNFLGVHWHWLNWRRAGIFSFSGFFWILALTIFQDSKLILTRRCNIRSNPFHDPLSGSLEVPLGCKHCVCVSDGYFMYMMNNEGRQAGCRQNCSRAEAACGGHQEGSKWMRIRIGPGPPGEKRCVSLLFNLRTLP